MQARILTASDGLTYRGVRLTWRYSQTYTCSDYDTYRASITGESPFNYGNYVDITFSQRQVDFLNLECNTGYALSVTMTLSQGIGFGTRYYSSGYAHVFYGSKLKVNSKF